MTYCPQCNGTFTKNHCRLCCETYSNPYDHCPDCCHTYLNSMSHCKICHKTTDGTLKNHCPICCFESILGIHHCCDCQFVSKIKDQPHCHGCKVGFDPTKQCHCCECGTVHNIGTDHCHDCKKSFPLGEDHICENFCKVCKKTWLSSQKHCNDCHENFLKKFPHKQCKQKPTNQSKPFGQEHGQQKEHSGQKKEQTGHQKREQKKENQHTSVPKENSSKLLENLRIIGYFEINPTVQIHIQNPTIGEIRIAYKKIALILHPDKNFGIDTTEQFKKVQNAFDWLNLIYF